ncbi:MAG: tetratricopeptide repeat protein, partial [Elusimicrobiaceae bacterium]|nr:tetratricopeptide repeat protein [Elusimicrobiaceae bacterium]
MKKLQFYALILLSFLIIGCDKDKQKKQLLEQIKNFQKQGQYSNALEKSSLLAKKFPNESRSYIVLGGILLQMDRFAEAKQAFSKAIDLDPQNGDPYYFRATANFEMDSFADALADCSQLIKLQPMEEAYELCALASAKAKNYQQAVDFYSQLLTLNPQNAQAYHLRGIIKKDELQDKTGGLEDLFQAGVLYTDQGDDEQAIEIFDIIAQENATSQLLQERGRAKVHLQDWQGAEKDFSQAITLEPNDWRPYMARCTVRIELKDYQGALHDCNQVISSAPKDAVSLIDAYSAIINAKAKLQDYPGAYQTSQKAIHDMPDILDFYVLSASTVVSVSASTISSTSTVVSASTIQNFEEQLSMITQAVQLYEQQKLHTPHVERVADAYALRGALRRFFGEHQGAIQDFSKAIELLPNEAENYQMRAEIKQQIGDEKGAREDFAQAKKLS